MKLDPYDEANEQEIIEDWERGLTPVQRFEKLIQYGQLAKLVKNSFFKSLDRAAQMDAISQTLDSLVRQLDRMSQSLLQVSSTHPEGVKLNRLAVQLVTVKKKLLSDFANGIDVVSQISDESEGKEYF